jgi:hypothetical protein
VSGETDHPEQNKVLSQALPPELTADLRSLIAAILVRDYLDSASKREKGDNRDRC